MCNASAGSAGSGRQLVRRRLCISRSDLVIQHECSPCPVLSAARDRVYSARRAWRTGCAKEKEGPRALVSEVIAPALWPLVNLFASALSCAYHASSSLDASWRALWRVRPMQSKTNGSRFVASKCRSIQAEASGRRKGLLDARSSAGFDAAQVD